MVSGIVTAIGIAGTIGTGIAYFYLLDRSNAALVLHEWGHAWGLEHCDVHGCLMNPKRDLGHLVAVVQNLSFCEAHDKQLREATGDYLRTTGRESLGKGLVFGYRYSGNIENVAKTVAERVREYGIDGVEYFQVGELKVPEDCIHPEEGWTNPACVLELLEVNVEEYSTSRLIAEVTDRPSFGFGRWGRSVLYHGVHYQVCFSPLNHAKWGFLTSILVPIGLAMERGERP